MAFRARSLARSPLNLSPSTFKKFQDLLERCGVAGQSTGGTASVKLTESEQLSENPAFHVFHPLFTPYFDFHNQQLTALGDTLIDDYLSDVTLDYCAHMGHVLTVNTACQLNAVFHNHFSLRLLASEYGLADLAIPVFDASSDCTSAGSSLDFLEARRHGVAHQDTRGTSFHVSPLSCGQSPLGWKLSHFVGAVHMAFGRDAGTAAIDSLYGLRHGGNIPGKAAALLLRVLKRFPPLNVAEAILAAQGLPARFVGKTRILSRESGHENSSQSTHGKDEGKTSSADCDPTEEGMKSDEGNSGLLALVGFTEPNSLTTDGEAQLEALASSAAARSSLANGPGLVDYGKRWSQRTDYLSSHKLEPSLPESTEEGWLSPTEQRAFRDGPAFTHAVDFSVHASFADHYGVSQPVDGQVIKRRKFRKPVRDPLFYDKMSDMRNGVPLSTNGEPLQDFLDAFQHRHRRLFEVTMLAGSGAGREVGRAIATRYTVARDSACQAYLGGVLTDLQSFSFPRASGHSVNEHASGAH